MAYCVKRAYFCIVLVVSLNEKTQSGKGMMYGIIIMLLLSEDTVFFLLLLAKEK